MAKPERIPFDPSEPIDRLRFERDFWATTPGALLAGVDEAGRGCLAGPVVAGAVVIAEADIEALAEGDLKAANDSKQLTEKRREALYECLLHHPKVHCGVGIASAQEIDSINILNATHLAMRRALEALPTLPAHALVDGLPVKGLPLPHTAIVKGDARSLLISCASIIAKVTRDHLCAELDTRYPGYDFAKHKAYGTKSHLAALHRLGPCPEHRRSFAPVAIFQEEFNF
jgi:ribonuclease HII